MPENPFPHIKTAPRGVEDEIIAGFIGKYGADFPHVTRRDYEMFVRGVVDNMFSREGIGIWMEESIPHLTPERLETIRQDPYFMLKESHVEEFAGYVPLAKWTEAEQAVAVNADYFSVRIC